MDVTYLLVDDLSTPNILVKEKDFLLVYKPPAMHSAPLPASKSTFPDLAMGKIAEETIFDWCAAQYPEIKKIQGRGKGEGGLLHRLDYETQGLMLIARTRDGMENLLTQQDKCAIVKEYCALTMEQKTKAPGFPPVDVSCLSGCIRSAFRPYGVGRKLVRPILKQTTTLAKAKEKEYITEILEKNSLSQDVFSWQIKITKGFRHQIRCHLAWIGMPIINDKLYGGNPFGKGILALRATAVLFMDPGTAKTKCYSLSPQLNKMNLSLI